MTVVSFLSTYNSLLDIYNGWWPPSRNFVCLFSARKFKIAFAISFMAKFIIRHTATWTEYKWSLSPVPQQQSRSRYISTSTSDRSGSKLSPVLGFFLGLGHHIFCEGLRPDSGLVATFKKDLENWSFQKFLFSKN